jgi:hypothetical protein
MMLVLSPQKCDQVTRVRYGVHVSRAKTLCEMRRSAAHP